MKAVLKFFVGLGMLLLVIWAGWGLVTLMWYIFSPESNPAVWKWNHTVAVLPEIGAMLYAAGFLLHAWGDHILDRKKT